MVVDVHTHIWERDLDMNERFTRSIDVAAAHAVPLTTRWDDYRSARPEGTVTVVFGGKARLSGLWVDDARVAAFASARPDEVIGFMSIDPTQDGWESELELGHRDLGLRGIKVLPMYAGFDPRDSAIDYLWSYAERHGLPVLSHTGTTFVRESHLDFARPGLFDEVARRHPDLRLILAHLGHPYEGECLAVIRKHPHVYADVSALHYRPFQLWHSLMLAQEYGVTHKLLFGSDFPFTTVDASIEAMRTLTEVAIPGLNGLDSDLIETVIHRESLPLLGLDATAR